MASDPPDSIMLVVRGLDPVGTGRQVELAAEAFRLRGWNTEIAMLSAGGTVAGRLAARGFRLHRLSRRPKVDAGAVAGLARLVSLRRPAVVYGEGRGVALATAQALGIVQSLRGSRCPRLVHRIAMPARTWGERWSLRQADLLLPVSAALAAACREAGCDAGRIDVIPPGAPVPDSSDDVVRTSRQDLASRLGLDSDKQWTLCVSPLEAAARLERLLWGIDQLGVVHQRVEHVLVGFGPLERQVRRRARVEELTERLFLFPHLDCLPDLLEEIDLVFCAGDVAHGGCLLDGLAAGVPAVAVESHASRLIVADGLTGRVVPAAPESELARRANEILENPGVAARYAEACRTRATEAFAAEPAASRLVAAVERLIIKD
jgi:glycosyltransferase involved in cell wall biosynthesis